MSFIWQSFFVVFCSWFTLKLLDNAVQTCTRNGFLWSECRMLGCKTRVLMIWMEAQTRKSNSLHKFIPGDGRNNSNSSLKPHTHTPESNRIIFAGVSTLNTTSKYCCSPSLTSHRHNENPKWWASSTEISVFDIAALPKWWGVGEGGA